MIVGVSTRNYARSLEPLPPGTETTATSKSEVSRDFVARTQAQLAEFLGRSLEDIDIPVVMLDGIHFGKHILLVALGIDREGYKQVLGVWEGSTESERTCRALLSNLVQRGLVIERARLFVVDGSKGLQKAIRTVFGAWALVARCRKHKLANVADHLPLGKRAWVRAAMNKAYASATPEEAKRRLLQLARSLEKPHPSAAASVREGLDETLTVMSLDVGESLMKTLRTTNPIENMNDTLRRVSRRVKRWRGGIWRCAGERAACSKPRRGSDA